MEIKIPTELLESYGEERVRGILDSRVAELQNQVVAQTKTELGEKLYTIIDSPEVQAAVAKADADLPDNTEAV